MCGSRASKAYGNCGKVCAMVDSRKFGMGGLIVGNTERAGRVSDGLPFRRLRVRLVVLTWAHAPHSRRRRGGRAARGRRGGASPTASRRLADRKSCTAKPFRPAE